MPNNNTLPADIVNVLTSKGIAINNPETTVYTAEYLKLDGCFKAILVVQANISSSPLLVFRQVNDASPWKQVKLPVSTLYIDQPVTSFTWSDSTLLINGQPIVKLPYSILLALTGIEYQTTSSTKPPEDTKDLKPIAFTDLPFAIQNSVAEIIIEHDEKAISPDYHLYHITCTPDNIMIIAIEEISKPDVVHLAIYNITDIPLGGKAIKLLMLHHAKANLHQSTFKWTDNVFYLNDNMVITLHPLASNIVKIDAYKLPMPMMFHLATELANRPGIKSDILSYSTYITNDCPADIKAVILVDINNPNITIFAAYHVKNQLAVLLNFAIVPIAVDLVNGEFKWDNDGLWYNKELVRRLVTPFTYKYQPNHPPVQPFTTIQPTSAEQITEVGWGSPDPKSVYQSPNLHRWGDLPEPAEYPQATPSNNILFASTQSVPEIIVNMSTLGLVLIHQEPTRLIFGKPIPAAGYSQPFSEANNPPVAPINIVVTLV